uniref:Uncharacterized protein n=1 Tax=Osmundaria fimbriata TaxID=228265 RepID=A0A1Z1M4Z1_OSMFI|nr:hypothetical protein [Osmundaria fimbriata]ARW60913.1 hypothetical protein [Osmundaria fimbriata]
MLNSLIGIKNTIYLKKLKTSTNGSRLLYIAIYLDNSQRFKIRAYFESNAFHIQQK